MKKKFRLKKSEHIQHVIEKGTSFANREFVLYHLSNENQPYFRLALSVGKKIGNACERNLMKRRMRAIIIAIYPELAIGKDYVLIARVGAKKLSFEQMESSIKHVFRKQKLIIKNK